MGLLKDDNGSLIISFIFGLAFAIYFSIDYSIDQRSTGDLCLVLITVHPSATFFLYLLITEIKKIRIEPGTLFLTSIFSTVPFDIISALLIRYFFGFSY